MFGASTAAPFGSQQQQQSVFGQNNNPFAATKPFGSSTTNPFGSSVNTPAFGATASPAFVSQTTTPASGAQPAPAFGVAITPFQQTSPFGAATAPAFSSQPAPAISAATTPAFGSQPFGVATNSTFGTSTTPAFGAQPFNFGLSPAFGQTNSGFGSSIPFVSTTSAFGTQAATATTSTFGSPGAFGQPGFNGGQQSLGGSRVMAYAPTVDSEQNNGMQSSVIKIQSISKMPVYKEKSHEELRWEDYQLGNKGGKNPAVQPFGTPFGTPQTNPSTTTSTANPSGGFPSFTSASPFRPTPGLTNPFGTVSTTSPFNPTPGTTNPFGTPSPTSLFNPTPGRTNPFGTPSTTSPFNPTPGTTNPFGTPSTTSHFNPTPGTTNAFSTGMTNGTPPSFKPPNFGQTSCSTFATSTTSSVAAPNMFGTPNSGFWGSNIFNSMPSQPKSSNTPFGQTNLSQQSQSAFTFPNCQQQRSAVSSTDFGFTSSIFNSASNGFGQSAFVQPSTGNQGNMVAPQPASVATNPFGTFPTMPQISIGSRTGSAPSIQYGISNMPVVDKPPPVRVSSMLLPSRHLSQRWITLPARSSHPKTDGARVPFFSDDEEASSTPKADALFIPRENPRALFIHPLEQEKHPSAPENGQDKEQTQPAKCIQKANGVLQEDHSKNTQNEHGADIEALMPKLRYSDYYTEPRIQELADKEREEPGFCGRVKEFVVGRHGFGSIKFAGETDVRNLDLESLVQFNNREVIVYDDESKKPPVGQGLNKAAVVTLLDIKCIDKKTGQQYMEGVRVEKYKEMLMKKARDQGTEFVSYNPIKGEWKFRVNHF